jgi:hypothetical protein
MPTDILLWYPTVGEELILGSGLQGFPLSVRSTNLNQPRGDLYRRRSRPASGVSLTRGVCEGTRS